MADREARGARRRLELGPEAAGLGGHGHGLGVDVEHRAHGRQVEGQRPGRRGRPAHDARAPALGHDPEAPGARGAHDLGDLRGAGRACDQRRPARDAPGVGVQEQDRPPVAPGVGAGPGPLVDLDAQGAQVARERGVGAGRALERRVGELDRGHSRAHATGPSPAAENSRSTSAR